VSSDQPFSADAVLTATTCLVGACMFVINCIGYNNKIPNMNPVTNAVDCQLYENIDADASMIVPHIRATIIPPTKILIVFER